MPHFCRRCDWCGAPVDATRCGACGGPQGNQLREHVPRELEAARLKATFSVIGEPIPRLEAGMIIRGI